MRWNDHTKCFTMTMITSNALQWSHQMRYKQCHTKCVTSNGVTINAWPHQMLYNDHTEWFTVTAPNALQWPHQIRYSDHNTKCVTMSHRPNAYNDHIKWPHQMLYNDCTKCLTIVSPDKKKSNMWYNDHTKCLEMITPNGLQCRHETNVLVSCICKRAFTFRWTIMFWHLRTDHNTPNA